MKIIFNKYTGQTYRGISKDQDIRTLYMFYDDEFINQLDELIYDNIPTDLYNYYVKNKQLKRYSDEEISEKQRYGRILSEDDRILESMKPTLEEINKAEDTIKLLLLLQEVL